LANANDKQTTSYFNLNKSPTKNNYLKKATAVNANKECFENEILGKINIDPIKENLDSKKIQVYKNSQPNIAKNKNESTSTTPISINPNNNNSSLNASNFKLAMEKPKNKGDRLKNLKYAEEEIKIKKSRLSRKQRRLQEAENTLASFLSKEDKFNLFNNDEGLNRINSNISVGSKNNNNNFINLHSSSSNNFNHQNSWNNNNTNHMNNNDASIFNQTNHFNSNQLNKTNTQQNKVINNFFYLFFYFLFNEFRRMITLY
jgi:hypothetical protein